MPLPFGLCTGFKVRIDLFCIEPIAEGGPGAAPSLPALVARLPAAARNIIGSKTGNPRRAAALLIPLTGRDVDRDS
jgi:hypothetical protein